MRTTVGLVGICACPDEVLLATAGQGGEGPCVVRQALADAVALERVDVEAGGLRLGLPQVHETAAQLRVVDQVGPVEVQLDVGDRHRLRAASRSITSPPSSPSSITITGPASPADPPTNP